VKPGGETDLGRGIEQALSMLGTSTGDQHIFLLTDALQTKGEVPERAVLPVVEQAMSQSVEITLLGLNLDDNGLRLAETITDRSDGDLYRVENAEDTDRVVIEAYEST
jgi:Mg-chelatase subunit ChlD